MSVFVHLIFLLFSCTAAGAMAVLLPGAILGIDRVGGLFAGAVTLLLGLLLHEIVARVAVEASHKHRLDRLQLACQGLTESAERLQARLEALNGRTAMPVPMHDLALDLHLRQQATSRIQAEQAERALKSPEVTEVEPVTPFPMPTLDVPLRASAPAQGKGHDRPERIEPVVSFPTPTPTPSSSSLAPRRSEGDILDALREALRLDRVELYLQPVVTLPQRKLRFYEVFSRVRDAEGVNLVPDQYIALAEREHLIAAIDNLLLFRCIRAVRETERQNRGVAFCCNVSAATLHDTGFMSEFVQFMGGHPDLAPKLVLELKQQDLLGREGLNAGMLDDLKGLGLRFSMDRVTRLDLPFADLARHEVRTVKVEAMRLLELSRSADGMKEFGVFKAAMAKSGLDLIVEKIETQADLLELLDLPVDFGQGYLLGEPKQYRSAA